MPNNVWTVEIAAKPEDVWPYVGTLERHADWSAGPFTVEWLSGEPNAPGSRFRSIGKLPLIGKDYPMEGEVLESEPPWRFVTSSSDKTGAYRNTITLEPRGQGILVTRVVDAPKSSGAMAVLMAVMFPLMVRPTVQKPLNLLKAKVEAAG